MENIKEELLTELKSIFLNKTFDAILPPIIFALSNNFFGLKTAIFLALTTALINLIRRLLTKNTFLYSLGGLLGVLFASGFAYLTDNASNYFIPALSSSFFWLITTAVSLLWGKPLAAWASHLSRGWPLKWFWRDDIKPAYREVTIFWCLFFTLRLIIQLNLYFSDSILNLAWFNLIFGWPAIISILILSYIYGVWRLRKLGGPGVDEFKADKKPPFEGQKKGF